MGKKQHGPEEFVSKLRQAEVLVGHSGQTTATSPCTTML